MLRINLVYAEIGDIALRYLACFSCSFSTREVLNSFILCSLLHKYLQRQIIIYLRLTWCFEMVLIFEI